MANHTIELLILVVTHPDHGCNGLLEWSHARGGRSVTIRLYPPTVEGGEIDTRLRGATGSRILVYHASSTPPQIAEAANVLGYNRSDDPDSISARIAGAAKNPQSDESLSASARATLRAARADAVEEASEWLRWLDGPRDG